MASKTSFLREKTDAECRQLAAQYWHRATKAEKLIREMELHIDNLNEKIARLNGLIENIRQQVNSDAE